MSVCTCKIYPFNVKSVACLKKNTFGEKKIFLFMKKLQSITERSTTILECVKDSMFQ
jgi:hypothetical protein